eukprot:Lankesteria_metandrocarpae@DN3050_c0_g1_i1.p1
MTVDVCIKMPHTSFDSKDYLNYRYVNKRLAYIAELQRQLTSAFAEANAADAPHEAHTSQSPKRRKRSKTTALIVTDQINSDVRAKATAAVDLSGLTPSFSIEPYCGDSTKPVIICSLNTPSRRTASWRVRLLPCISNKAFNPDVLRHSANCVRTRTERAIPGIVPNYYFTPASGTAANNSIVSVTGGTGNISKLDVSKLPPTPTYNSAVMEDLRLRRHYKLFRSLEVKYRSSFTKAVLLIKIWAAQRGLVPLDITATAGTSDGTLERRIWSTNDFFILAAAHVCLTNTVAAAVGYNAVFKLVMDFLGNTDFSNNDRCAVLGCSGTKPVNALTSTALQSQDDLARCRSLFYDSEEQSYNILWRCGVHLDEIQFRARQTFTIMQGVDDPFDATFATQYCPELHCDARVVYVPGSRSTQTNTATEGDDVVTYRIADEEGMNSRKTTCVDISSTAGLTVDEYEGPVELRLARRLVEVVKRGLDDRISLCTLRFVKAPRSTGESMQGTGLTQSVLYHSVELCITLDAEACKRTVDRFANSDHTEQAATFSAYWGDISKDRRFVDGSIVPAVVWRSPVDIKQFSNTGAVAMLGNYFDAYDANSDSSTTPTATSASDRVAMVDPESYSPDTVSPCNALRSVPLQILLHVLRRHFPTAITRHGNLPASFVSGDQIGDTCTDPQCVVECSPLGAVVPTSQLYSASWSTFHKLRELFFGLGDTFPLQIKDVRSLNDQLRDIDLQGFPFSHLLDNRHSLAECAAIDNAKTIIPPHEVVVEFQSSSGWPSNVEAIKKVKAALLVKLSEVLTAKSTAATPMRCALSAVHLDFTYGGVLFRARIFHPQEVSKVAAYAADINVLPKTRHPAEHYADLRNLWWRPHVWSVLQSVGMQHAAFNGTIRLCRLWFGLHLLSGCEDWIDHLAAHIFLCPEPFQTPTSPHGAFYRIMSLIEMFNWGKMPFIAELEKDNKISQDSRQKMVQSHEMRGTKDSVCPAVWMSSAFDPHSVLFRSPSHSVCRKAVILSRACCAVFRKASSGFPCLSRWSPVMLPDLKQFDLLLRFERPESLVRLFGKTATRKRTTLHQAGMSRSTREAVSFQASVVDEAFRQFVKNVEIILGSHAVLGYDPNHFPCPPFMAIKFLPSSFLLSSLKPACSVPQCILSPKNGKVDTLQFQTVPNAVSLLGALFSLGEGLVRGVEWV